MTSQRPGRSQDTAAEVRRRLPPLALLLVAAALVLAACAGEPDPSVPATTAPPATTGGATTIPPPTTSDAVDDGATGATGTGRCGGGAPGAFVLEAADGELRATAGGRSPVDLELDTSRLAPDRLAGLIAALDRDQRQIVVSSPDSAGPHPVLLEFHGYGSSAVEETTYSGLAARATAAGYLVVAIDGRDQPRRWELRTTDPDPAAIGVSDVAVVDAIVDIVLPSFCGDPQQLHAAGLSNGSVFSAVLACRSRHRFQAVGSVSFTTGRAGCGGDRQVPTVAFHGTADVVVPYAGRSVPLITAVLGWDLQPAEEAMAEKAALNGCDGFEDESIGDDVVRRTWQGCDAATVFYRIEGGGHGWPGPFPAPSPLLATTDTVDASDVILEFFQQQ